MSHLCFLLTISEEVIRVNVMSGYTKKQVVDFEKTTIKEEYKSNWRINVATDKVL